MTFAIPELRQMLAEAQELAEQESIDNGDFGPIGDCPEGCANCDCQTLAPLADESELLEDFIDRLNNEQSNKVEESLNRVERALDNGDIDLAKTLLDLAYARKDLL